MNCLVFIKKAYIKAYLYLQGMLILKVEGNPIYYNTIREKLKRVMKNFPIHVEIIQRKGVIYLTSLDDGLSTTFIYSAYLKAKEKGLRTSLMYARYIEERWLPEEIRRLAEKWLFRGLNKREVELLKNISITEYMLRRW